MVYTVTFNPALDYVMKVGSLRADDINRSSGEAIYYGGKGINVSAVLTRLGVENTALGFLAGFTGKQLEKMMITDGLKCDFNFLPDGNTRINVKIKAESELDINASGPTISADDIDALIGKLKKLRSGDILVLAGSVPDALGSDAYEKIMARLDGVKVVVDATGELLTKTLKRKPFLIKPNHLELGEIFGVSVETEADIIRYAKMLQEQGAQNVLVSRAENGAVLVDENGCVSRVGAASGRLVNSVGCGDSMVAGFIAGYLRTNDYSYALKLGTACAAATAFSEGLAEKDEIEKLLNKIM